jgi:hypothetical protein
VYPFSILFPMLCSSSPRKGIVLNLICNVEMLSLVKRRPCPHCIYNLKHMEWLEIIHKLVFVHATTTVVCNILTNV